jgi:hypothetical protein
MSGVGCDPTQTAGCNITVATGTEYAIRLTAQNLAGSVKTYSYAAMFLSKGANDGFISQNLNRYTNHANDPEPGILAGEPSSSSSMHYRGFLSFHTGDLGSVAVLGAKLRLKQETSGTNFNPNNQCMVDIKNGYFGTSAGLDRSYDFNDTTATTTNAFSIIQADPTTNWFEANLVKSTAAIDINLESDGRTQFRIYFSTAGSAGHNEGWYSGNSAGTSTDYPPQLLVRYQ